MLRNRLLWRQTSNKEGNTLLLNNRKAVRNLALLITYGLVLYWVFNHPAQAGGLLRRGYAVISPFVLGFCIAFVLNVVMRPLEQLWNRYLGTKAESLRRPVCMILSMLLFIGVVFAVLFILIPQLKATVMSFGEMLPEYIREIEGWWQTISEFLGHYGAQLPKLTLDVEKITNWAADLLTNVGSGVVNTTVNVTTSIVTGVVNFILALVFSIYLLLQKEMLSRQLSHLIQAFLPEQWVRRLFYVVQVANRSFSSFVTGQLTEAVIIGTLCLIGMLLLGMPYALAISVLVGFTALIPVFGAFIGTGIGAFLILLVSPAKAFWFLVFILVLQQFEGNLIYPRVVGKSVGLPGIWVLTAVTVGSSLGGITGMLMSVPICSMLYTMLRELVHYRLRESEES